MQIIVQILPQLKIDREGMYIIIYYAISLYYYLLYYISLQHYITIVVD